MDKMNHILAVGLCSLLLWVQLVMSGGTGTVRFVAYHNPTHKDVNGDCCDTPGSSGCSSHNCDPYFVICVGRYGTSSCEYGQTKTSPSDGTDDINFGSSIGSLHNPIIINNFVSWGDGIRVTVNVIDKDGGIFTGNDDTIGTINHQIKGPPYPYGARRIDTTETITGGAAQLVIQYSFICKQYYYGDCATYCRPLHPKYKCGPSGEYVCLPGWVGYHCNDTDNSCAMNPCMHGAACTDIVRNHHTCTCSQGWTGRNCQTHIATSSVKTTHVSSAPATHFVTSTVSTLMTSTTQSPMTSTKSTSTTQTPMTPAHLTSTTLSNSQTTTDLFSSQTSDKPSTISVSSSKSSTSTPPTPTSTTSSTTNATGDKHTTVVLPTSQTTDTSSIMAATSLPVPRNPVTTWTASSTPDRLSTSTMQPTRATASIVPPTSTRSTHQTTSSTTPPTFTMSAIQTTSVGPALNYAMQCTIKITTNEVNGTTLVDISGFNKKSLTDGDIKTIFGQLIPPSDLHQLSSNDTVMVYGISKVQNVSALENTTLSKVERALCRQQNKVPTEPKARKTKQDGGNSSSIRGIVIGVVGGLFLTLTLGAIIFLLYRRWRNMKFNKIMDQTSGNTSRSTCDVDGQGIKETTDNGKLETTNPSDKQIEDIITQ